jgi:hyperosmotically inducible periplasmic protein
MKALTLRLPLLAVMVVGTLLGCSKASTKAADVSGAIRASLDQGGYKEVSVSQDRDKGVVTLGGHVEADADKSRAESIARSIAAGQVVANEIAVTPSGAESEAKKVNAELDEAIGHNLDAALIKAKLHKGVKYSVKNQVVTLNGKVNSQTKRARIGKIAARVPHVQQVVNELQVKGQKATEVR